MGELVTVFNDGGLKVEALAVDHAPVDPAVGYRFSCKDRSLLITGDTVKSANVLKFAEDIFPDYTVGKDGVAFSLPANTDEIIRTSKGL